MTQLKPEIVMEQTSTQTPSSVEAQQETKHLDMAHEGAAASRGLSQTFGLDPRAAVLTIIVDLMVFGGVVMSFGTLIVVGCIVAVVLAMIVYQIQIHWYKDDHQSALIKAMIVGLLTAIPEPVTPFLAISSGFLGVVRYFSRR